jgi:2-amino-4-hydroxy-6-hydroxymethyldihydropteridine diphosphokinase
MNDLHRMYLNLGSNVAAETNLPAAVNLLRKAGCVETVSSVWETESVGLDGPNFLNACVLFHTPLGPVEFKERIIRPIEAELGRVRSAEKNAPRTIDIDIVLYDEEPLNMDFWAYAFVIVPLAELIPNFPHPGNGEAIARAAGQVQVWIQKRADVVIF